MNPIDYHHIDPINKIKGDLKNVYSIVNKRELGESIYLIEIEAAQIAPKVQTGQFVVIRVDAEGERIPLTVADQDLEAGTIAVIFQAVGVSTAKLAALKIGDSLLDLVGPLGLPTPISETARRVCIVGGGLGCAIAYPQAKSLTQAGFAVDMIAGFRTKDLVILEEEMRANTENLYVTTDDGSYGEQGFTTTKLEALINEGKQYDLVIAIGPTVMMKFLCLLTAQFNLPTIVSLNPIMIDGTGLCGCCRVTINGETKFACVDGPDFDGHAVDFDELMARNTFYAEQETAAYKAYKEHVCNLTGEVRNG